jgi:hypothetical protein
VTSFQEKRSSLPSSNSEDTVSPRGTPDAGATPAGSYFVEVTASHARYAALPKGWAIEDERVLYQLKPSAERRVESLRKAGHECELVLVPQELVDARIAKALASIKTGK